MSTAPSATTPRPRVFGSATALAWLCRLLALALPVTVVAWVIGAWPEALLGALAEATGATAIDARGLALSGWRVALAGVLVLLPVLLMAGALLRAARCLAAIARGEHFSAFAVGELRGFAALMCAATVLGVLVPPLALLTLQMAGAGPYSLRLSFGSQQLFLLVFSALTWQIAAVLARAVALAEEHAQIV